MLLQTEIIFENDFGAPNGRRRITLDLAEMEITMFREVCEGVTRIETTDKGVVIAMDYDAFHEAYSQYCVNERLGIDG